MIQIETGDFRQLSDGLADGSVDLVLTDPPYPREYLPLWGDLARIAARVLQPGGSLLAYCGHYSLPYVLSQLEKCLRYHWLITRLHNGAQARLPGKWVFVGYKPIVWFVKEKRNGRRYVSDCIADGMPDKRYHKWGQSIEPVALSD